jgi:hypothetical protein
MKANIDASRLNVAAGEDNSVEKDSEGRKLVRKLLSE